jgi:cytoskeleton protein RodZ
VSTMNAGLDDQVIDEPVEVRRNGGLAAGIGGIAAAVAIAYLARATGSGSWVDWALVVVMGAVGAAYLRAFVDARTPLLVADTQGVRIRLGRSWRGVPWSDIEHVEHRPRRGLLRDGRLVLVARDPVEVFGDLDSSGRRQARLTDRLYGAPLAIPLALSTRVTGAGEDLTATLEQLAGNPDQVVEVVPEQELDESDQIIEAEVGETEYEDLEDYEGDAELDDDDRPLLHDPRPALARGIGFVATRLRLTPSTGTGEPTATPDPTIGLPMVASATPIPLRDPVGGSRTEVRFEGAAALKTDPYEADDTTSLELPEARELRRAGSVDLGEDTIVWSERVRPISREGDAVQPLVIDDFSVEPADDPVVGPELAAARTRLSLTVDQLAERTRIRPHVIESIEVDDFAPCGGDFYARGHLRTLARVLGVDAAPLLSAYDERYADAPIDARRVFEAELATGVGGPIRGTRGGPNWSVLVAAVMALVLVWSIARLIMDSPVELHSKPILNGSGGANSQVKLGPAVPVKLVAASGGAHVVVRDGAGEVVFNGDLAFGETKTVQASPPVRVQSSDGALELTVDGQSRGPLGADGQPAQNTFAASS